MRIPPWLTIGVAVLVIAFGLYRLRLALKPAKAREGDAEDPATRSIMGKGFYRMSSRAHAFVGIIYLALGAALIGTMLGWNPLGGLGHGASDSGSASDGSSGGGILLGPSPAPTPAK